MAKTTKFAKTGVKRDNKRMYYVKGNAVWSTGRTKPRRPKKEATFKGKLDYKKAVYFVDRQGDVAEAKRSTARKRKRSAKR